MYHTLRYRRIVGIIIRLTIEMCELGRGRKVSPSRAVILLACMRERGLEKHGSYLRKGTYSFPLKMSRSFMCSIYEVVEGEE